MNKPRLKKINEFIQLLNEKGLMITHNITEDFNIEHVSCNSNDILNGTLFLCKGISFKKEYLDGAIQSGASCYISEKKYDVETYTFPYIIVKDIRKAMAYVSHLFYEYPWKNLNLIGITGTKGKSTTAYYVKYILDEYLKQNSKPESAIISSIDTYDGVILKESHLTTPESLELTQHFYNAVSKNIEYFTMEVSSQALKYDRVLDVDFDVACYLNIGEDHISSVEHSDMDDYFYSKMKIFKQSKVSCINLDAKRREEVLTFARDCEKIITFSTSDENADIYGYDIVKSNNDINFKVRTKNFSREFTITMPGLFNVENALAAIAICYALNIPESCMYIGLMKARSSGRMETYTNANNKVIVIVDYAHNKMSFESLYSSVLKEYPGRKIITVFGCPGNKAQTRRKDLGELSGIYSNKVIITEEDPGNEPLIEICQEIAMHVNKQKCLYEIIEDRGEAIKRAVFDTLDESIVLITGKGNETRQKRGSQYVDCPSDVAYALQYLKEYDIANKYNLSESIDSISAIYPKLSQYSKKKILIKFGGSIIENDELMNTILQDISILRMFGIQVLIVHGGGSAISQTLNKLGISTEFYKGYRITNKEAIDTVEMVLSGNINKKIVQKLLENNITAVGISGKDSAMVRATKKLLDNTDIGFVGEITTVDTKLINVLLEADYLPVISPVGIGDDFNTYNINADDAACGLAAAIHVDKLIFITDVDGVLLDNKNSKTIIHDITVAKAENLIQSGFVGGGMIPKLYNCVKAVKDGVGEVVILNGNVSHSILSEIMYPRTVGTTIRQ